MHLSHLASRLYGTPLLIARPKLEVILAVLGNRIGWPEAQAALPVPPARALPEAPPGIAVIPVHGTLVRRAFGLEAASGLTSYAQVGSQLEAALADPRIEGILLDVDSPGGEAGGVFELGESIRAAAAVKPVWAIASDAAFSAAYALACAASRLVVTRTGGVGSIGVIALHMDQSARDAQDGVRFTAIHAGARKNDYSPHAPLTAEATARLQAEVDRLYALFVEHVATLRGLDDAAVRATEAGLYFGAEAVAAGLADAEGGFDTTLGEFADFLATRRARTRTPQALSASLPSSTETLQMQRPEDPTPPDTDVASADAPDDAPNPPPAPAPDALAIAELCQLAGRPERIAAFLAEGLSEAQVRRTLLAARADSVEITSMLRPDAASAGAPSPVANPLLAAVKKLASKD